jgi:hypothetical protein
LPELELELELDDELLLEELLLELLDMPPHAFGYWFEGSDFEGGATQS